MPSMIQPAIPGIKAAMITSSRITTRVLTSGRYDGIPVLFLHGNLSSAAWWEGTMASLPSGYRGIAPDQRGFGDADRSARIDATRGMRDLAEDAVALLDAMSVAQAHIVGMSLGGSVMWQMLMDFPGRFLTATLAAPGSPYGAGGTRDADGTPCFGDYAGSGAGLINRKLVRNLRAGDRSTNDLFSPRTVLRTLVVRPGCIPEHEEELLTGMLGIHVGELEYPGDVAVSSNWPYVAPGRWGATNALSPKYAGDIARLFLIDPMPGILWIRGSDDLAVSDSSSSDPGRLGQVGLIPDWPGMDIYPPQPSILQTRAVLERYAAAGGIYKEVVIPDCGHVPFIEKPGEANAVFHRHILPAPDS